MLVLDASVCVSILHFEDEYHVDSLTWFEQQSMRGTAFLAPTLLPAEVAGVLARLTGRSAIGRAAIARLRDLIRIQLVPLDREHAVSYATLAADLRLRGADAVYVAVAQELDVPLITWDRQQRSRATEIIPVFTPTSFRGNSPTGEQ